MSSLAALWMDQTQFDVVFQFITGIYPSHMAASNFRSDISSTALPQEQLNSRLKHTLRLTTKKLFDRICVYFFSFFHIRTVHLDIIKVIYTPTNAQVTVLKTILKFTLKQLRHVSVRSYHLQGAHYSCFKVTLVKIVNYGTSVCD